MAVCIVGGVSSRGTENTLDEGEKEREGEIMNIDKFYDFSK